MDDDDDDVSQELVIKTLDEDMGPSDMLTHPAVAEETASTANTSASEPTPPPPPLPPLPEPMLDQEEHDDVFPPNPPSVLPPEDERGEQGRQDACASEGGGGGAARRRLLLKKGNLKSQGGPVDALRKARRVSFDPLALLLDASLEGELELVKKTALEVCHC